VRFRSEVLDVKESPLVRIATAAEQVPGALRLQYGESDSPTPQFICDAAYQASLDGHTFYTDPSGYAELREAIAEKFLALQGVEYRPSQVTATVGATQAIGLVIRAFIGAGDNAVVLHPAYSIFNEVVTLFGGEPRAVPLVREGSRFRLDVDRLKAAVDARTRLLVVNSPSNPTGWVATRAEQEAIWELALERDLMVLSDEVYDRLVFDEPVAPSLARIATDPDRLIVVNSLSKTYAMTGWRLGWAMSSEKVVGVLAKVEEFMTSSAPAMIQRAAIAALRDGEAYIEEMRTSLAHRRRLVSAALANLPDVWLPEPAGAFYAFPKVAGLEDSMAGALELLREAGVALAPGSAFGKGGEGHLRLCFAGSEAVLVPALQRLRGWLEQRAKEGGP
jgi:aspartate/methionine/tyrosine aminotransferase